MVRFVDDVGAEVPLPKEVLRVVSLVPSLTEALVFSHPEKLVAAADWCTHPADLVVARVGGMKTPDHQTGRRRRQGWLENQQTLAPVPVADWQSP